jgi:hypothetical protein
MTKDVGRRRIRRLKWAIAGIDAILLLIWLVGYAHGPSREVARISVDGSDGERHEVILLEAEPIIHFPGFYTSVRYVQFGKHKKKLHGSSFGEHPGPILVSPSRNQIIATRRFKGGTFGGILIDLVTGEMVPTQRGREEAHMDGWEQLSWFDWDR